MPPNMGPGKDLSQPGLHAFLDLQLLGPWALLEAP